MKTLITILLAFAFLTGDALAQQGKKFSEYPNSGTLQAGDLFIFSHAGAGTFNIDAISQLPGALGIQPTNANLTGWSMWGTNAFANVVSNNAFVSALSQINTTSNSLQGQITSGGVTLTQLNATSNSVYGNAITQINATSNSVVGTGQASVNTASNTIVGRTVMVSGTANQITSSAGAQPLSANIAVTLSLPSALVLPGTITGNASGLTNLLNLAKFTAGANTVLTPAKDTTTGATNWTIAVSDPATFSQVNVSSFYATNLFTPTNAFAGAVADFAKSEATTNLSGALTFTGIANPQGDANNGFILHAYPGGSDRVIAVPGSWHIARGSLMVVSNAFNHSDFLVTAQVGFSTNIAQLDYP